HLVEISAEQQEGGQPGGGDSEAFGERFRGVAHGIQGVGDVAGALGGARELGDAAGVVCNRSEGVHWENVGGGHEHAHRGDGGAEDAGGEAAEAGEVCLRAGGEGGGDSDAQCERGGARRLV